MTLEECVAQVMQDRPSEYDEERITSWINEVEAMMQREVMRITDDSTLVQYDWTNPTDRAKDLLIPVPYDAACYLTYVFAQMDKMHNEAALYNNEMQMFNNGYSQYRDWQREQNEPTWGYKFRNF